MMKNEPPVPLPFDWPEAEMREFCHRWRVIELAIFGSALRADFGPGSDVDLLVRFAPGAGWSAFDHVQMESELREILKRDVDLVTRLAVEESPNRNRRAEILSTARPIYAA
jgi:predicted nucleotidyltransferase